MNDLVTIEYGEPVTTSMVISTGVERKHEHVVKLIKRYSHIQTLSGLTVRKVKSGGRPMSVYILTERQAAFLITLMDNSDLVLNFKERLVNEFFDMKNKLSKIALNQQNKEWLESREGGKVSRREGTDTIKEFIEYAKEQGSSKPGMYYMSLSKMENKALWMLEGKFENVRDALSGQQLQVVASADLIAARALKRGMSEGLHYKDIYKMARDDVMSFSSLIGKTPVPMGITFTDKSQIEFKD